jgi:hypothetical protein
MIMPPTHGRINILEPLSTAALLCGGFIPRREYVLAPQKIDLKRDPSRLSAFSSEVDTASREENASKQEAGASVLIQSEPKGL